MKTVSTRGALNRELQRHRGGNKSIGLVPTMGNLHAGHMALVSAAAEQCDVVVVTIFVNPLQFGPAEDLAAYPRTPEQDSSLLRANRCDVLYCPAIDELYPDGINAHSKVTVPILGRDFCGASRPGHFDGVTTVVAKLFNLIQPNIAFFGLKDYQQFLVISKMVSDLAMTVKLIGVETVREQSGLALSSRNQYLSSQQRSLAPRLHAALQATATAIRDGDHNYLELERDAALRLGNKDIRLDYFAIRDASTLQAPSADTSSLVILGAIQIGSTRLIDNIRVCLNS